MTEAEEKTFDQIWRYICDHLTPEQQAQILASVDDALRQKGGRLLEDQARADLDRRGANWIREHFI